MEVTNQRLAKGGWLNNIMRSVNLRSEEIERTLLLFLVYTFTSIGLIWLELSTIGLFLDQYGAEKLPWIYVATAVVGSGLGFIYSWLQKILPLRRVIVVIQLLMAVPLFLFRFGIGVKNIQIAGLTIGFITIFLMWLWVEACYILDDLNTSISSNQLFNIREIKRTYPIVSSGFLVAGAISGFSLPLLLYLVGINNVTIISGIMVGIGSSILLYLTEKYKNSFPDSARWDDDDEQPEHTAQKLKGPIQGYVILLITFFVMVELLYVLVDFQFFYQLELNSEETEAGASGIVSFLGLFEGVLSLFQVVTQWFASSRVVERMGVFVTAMILPALIGVMGIFSLGSAITGLFSVFLCVVILRFLDELLHYTLIETTGPVLFQPIPDNARSGIQTVVNGVIEPLTTGASGVIILLVLWLTELFLKTEDKAKFEDHRSLVLIAVMILAAITWLIVVWLIRSQYVGLLVQSAERGRLGVTDGSVDLGLLKKAVVETLEKPGPEADKRSCIELLNQIDAKNIGDTLAPLLEILAPSLQKQSLETMLLHPSSAHLEKVRALCQTPLPPEVLALALRYIWLTDTEPDVEEVRQYLSQSIDPVVRGTAAALIMRQGDRNQKAEATNVLRRMITSKQEKERVMGVRALGEAEYLQGLRLYIPNLLQDESLRVRCALLEVIASTRLEEFYPSLLRGLYYKSTREAALQAVVKLENSAIALLVDLAEDIHKPDLVRLQAWTALGLIGTNEAIDELVNHLMTSWGTTRRNILRILVKMPQERGIEGVLERVGRSGVEILIEQELMFIGQIYAALVDLKMMGFQQEKDEDDEDDDITVIQAEDPPRNQAILGPLSWLQGALKALETDSIERCFLLMKFLYPLNSIQAAAFNIQSGSGSSMARGIEILDNTVDLNCKRSLLSVLETMSDRDKLGSLNELIVYRPLNPSDRLRRLLELRHFLSDWALACCFHLARTARWSLTAEQTLVCLRHPTGFVREAVLAYLQIASQRALVELLPTLSNDPDRLVASQVSEMITKLGVSA